MPITLNPDPFPTIRSPSLLPVPGDPFSVRFAVIIIWCIVTGRGIVPSVIDRRGCYKNRWSNKNPKMAMTTMVAAPGEG